MQLNRNTCIAGMMAALLLICGACRALADTDEAAAPALSAAPAIAERAVNPPGVFPIVDEKVTLRVMVLGNDLVEDFRTNYFTRWYEELTNIHIEWEVVPPLDAEEKLRLTLAKGDLPDILLNLDVTPIQQVVYGQTGALLPLNELIAEYGLETRKVFEQYPELEKAMTTPDRNIYALPRINENYHYLMPQKMWIYKPWLDKLGLAMPQTPDELYEVLRAFKTMDPNGNGVADEIPLAGNAEDSFSHVASFIMNAFVFYNKTINPDLYLEDGRVSVYFNRPGYREGLRYLYKLYAEGLIMPESFTMDERQLKRLVESKQPVVGVVPSWGIYNFADISSDHKRYRDYVAIPPLRGPSGLQVAPYNPYPFDRGVFVIASASRHPEAAFRWADALYAEEMTLRAVHGRPGKEWSWAKPAEIGIDGNPARWVKALTYGVKQNYHWYQTGPAKQDYRLRSSLASTGPDDPETILYTETMDKYRPYKQEEANILPPLFFTERQASELAELDLGISSYVSQMMNRFILGDASVDEDWDRYIRTLEDMNLDRYLQIYQEAYEAQYGALGAWRPMRRH